jgi:succinylglutamic semialdehyde dehydrogenase
MGGKNATIVCDDAALDAAIFETLSSAFLTTGQRCTATSRVLVHRSVHQAFVEKFHEKAKKFQIGHPLDNPFMGPLIDAAAVEKYMTFTGIAEREGCEIIMRGKPFEADYDGYYVTPSLCLVKDSSLQAVKKSVYQQTEVFGPNVAIYVFDDLEEAVKLTNATQFGLAASVFTAKKENFVKASHGLRAGIINWNRSTVGASSRLPFGGIKRSGNHVPAAISAIDSCVYPVATLQVEAPTVPAQGLPGLGW